MSRQQLQRQQLKHLYLWNTNRWLSGSVLRFDDMSQKPIKGLLTAWSQHFGMLTGTCCHSAGEYKTNSDKVNQNQPKVLVCQLDIQKKNTSNSVLKAEK